VLFAVCVIAATAAAAQWHYLSGGKLSGISSVGSFVWAVGQDGLFFYSEDNGQHWRRVPRFTTRNLVDVEFWDQSLGLVTAEGGIVYRTTDDGARWDSMNVPHSGNRIRWLSASSVYIAARDSSFLLRSNDAGLTWYQWYPPGHPWFLDTLHGWAGQCDSVMSTRNGGVSWVGRGNLPNPDWVIACDEFGFADTLTGICGFEQDYGEPHNPDPHYYCWAATADGGGSWASLSSVNQSPIRGCDVASNGRVFALEEKRCGWYQYGGLNWVSFSRTQSLYDVHAVRGDCAWICGCGGAVWKSPDGGQTWQLCRASNGTILSNVQFSDSTHGWASGYGGLVLKTTDAGRSWSDVSVSVSWGYPYTSIAAINSTTAVCCLGYSRYTEMGYYWYGYFAALRTSDAGVSWDTTRFVDMQNDWDGPIGSSRIARQGGHLWHAGLRTPNGNSLRSTDGGVTWLDMDTLGVVSDRQEPYDISFVDTLHGWAIDSRKDIRLTANGGDSWTIIATGLNVKRLKMTTLTTGWAISDSELFKTTDGGVTWEGAVADSGLQAIAFCDSSHGVIVGLHGLILRTSDAGQTWVRDSSEFTSDFYDVCMLDSTHAWAVGQYGLVLGFGDWAIGVNEAGEHVSPRGRPFAVSVRPNPCRVRATVEFSSPLSKPTQVKLVDAAGRVRQAVSVRAGARYLDLDMRDTPSGVYFVHTGAVPAVRLVVQH